MFRFRVKVNSTFVFYKEVEASSIFAALEQVRSELSKYVQNFFVEETDQEPPVRAIVVDNKYSVKFQLTDGNARTYVANALEIAYLNGYMAATDNITGEFFHLVPLPVELFAALFLKGDPEKANALIECD